MRTLLLLAVVAATVPLFASEIPVSPPVLVRDARGDRIAAASDGTSALVAWSERR